MSAQMGPVDSSVQVVKPILGFVLAELIINCFIVLLVLLVVGLRVVGRLAGPGLGWDDGFVIFATPLGVAMLCCQGLFAPAGNGYPLPTNLELAANIPFILKLTFCMQIIYVTLLAAVKASMLSFFIRVFPTPFMQKASKAALGFVGLWTIAFLGACIFLCSPVQNQWENPLQCKGQYMPMIQSLIATNAVGDLIIMALPMHSVWGLKTRRAEKIGITSCFALGLACVVCAVFRLIYISTVDLNANITGTMATTVFLFILEPNLAILCVSIPMLRPFYAKYKKRMGGSRLDEYSNSRSTGFRDMSRTGASSAAPEAVRDPNLSTWEMDDYRPQDKIRHGYSVSGFPDESGSEKNLTVGSSEAPKGEISVETKWTVTHSTRK
ncbi:hypothetical protein FVEN_g2800 [Fusarium venenatum]|uniref:Rhodopsin domain-containing protein n=1 Tax=Fusarium venenatum TaxID=56646 RepID=A0A2L2TBL3_9HYPO|nr:uncharacterized protein FVRRES_06173 [Fusarium venenatum]KAG8359394.1 hypothetical protein FVEN_g2800 [Fusarium venenatum]KAH6993194.1 hypothetical protein EDB82DRAFT_498676 [Fusarium venenatum]CEI61737.1 unnamed protein product [Fusarium venenatum]